MSRICRDRVWLTLTVLAVTCFGAVSLALAQQSDRADGPDADDPLDLGVVERAERRLVQLDISLRPDKTANELQLPRLDVGDLELVVGGRIIPLRYVDRACQDVSIDTAVAPTPPDEATEDDASPPVSAPTTARTTFVFFLEHGLLTMSGQATALTMARELIPELVTRGNRGFVISSGLKLEQSALTDDPGELLAFLSEHEKNPDQWLEIMFAEGEYSRTEELLRILYNSGPQPAQTRAQVYIREERAHINRRINRLSATIGSLIEMDPPKVVLYFADLLRKNPGEHYARLLGIERNPKIRNMVDESHAFDRVTMAAGEHGVRVYTIQSEGIRFVQSRERAARSQVAPSSRLGTVDALDAMRVFAAETGGEMFYGGTGGATLNKLRTRIQSDLACIYLLSFYPEELQLDSALAVRVRFNPDSQRFPELSDQFSIHARGQLVVQSESRRKESLLLAAHAVSGTVDSLEGHGAFIPLGFEDGRFQAMVQFAVASPDLSEIRAVETLWELGMTHVGRERVMHQVDRSVKLNDPSVPLVLQEQWEFRPGVSEIVGVGYENRFSRMAISNLALEWPDPNGQPAVVTPIAVVQGIEAVFVASDGDAEVKRSALALGDHAAHVDRPFYLMSVVCRGKRERRPLRIERELSANVKVPFDPQSWDYLEDERCIAIHDLVPAGQVGSGRFEYEVRVVAEGEPTQDLLARRLLVFDTIDPAVRPSTSSWLAVR